MTKNDTNLLRCLAILLITNSHLDAFFPPGSLLGGGGALGNALFFMLSGLGLTLSPAIHQSQHILDWMARRLKRLYPALWLIVSLLSLTPGHGIHWRFPDLFKLLIYPTPYWFISALVLFYGLFYLIMRCCSARLRVVLLIGLCIPYAVGYLHFVDLSHFSIENNHLFKWIFYFQTMLLGSVLADDYRRHHAPRARTIIACLLCLLAYLALKSLLAHGLFLSSQWLLHALTIPILITALRTARHPCVEALVSRPGIQAFIRLFSGLSLEIYLVQEVIIEQPRLQHLPLPWNLLCFWLITVASAWLVSQCVQQLGRLQLFSKKEADA